MQNEHIHARQRWKILPVSILPFLGPLGIRTCATIAGVAIAAVAVSLATAPNTGGVLASGLALTSIAIAVIDARIFIIPDELNIAGLILGLAYAGFVDQPALDAIAGAALRGLVLALIFLAVRVAYRWLRGRQGIGLGDIKLAAVAGVWLDWPMIPIAVQIATVTALGVYLTRQLAGGRSIRSTSRLPFGLFLAPAIWLGWILDQWLIV
jgi:leader peptidase (prepilin peptidase)/N-methyltransferase